MKNPKNIRGARRNIALAVFVCAVSSAVVSARAEQTSISRATVAERSSQLLESLGGVKVWNDGYVDYEAVAVKVSEADAPLLFEFWFHLRQPKTIVRVRRFNQDQVRVYDGDKGWTITRDMGRHATVKSWTAERIAQEYHDWNTNPAVQFARFARGEAGFEVADGGETFPGWLLFRRSGEDLLYLDTDATTGAPAAMFQVGVNDSPTILDEPKEGMGFRIMSGGLSNGKTPFEVLHARLIKDDAEISFTLKGVLEQFDLVTEE